MKIVLIVLDSAGVGYMPDAHLYDDVGAATIPHIFERHPDIDLPNLRNMGLFNIDGIFGLPNVDQPQAIYGRAAARSVNKDTLVGHWEMMGSFTDKFFDLFLDKGFPADIIEEFCKKTGVDGILGNYAASGTEIIKVLGKEHIRTGQPIVYTSVDSVFQIAAHENVIPIEKLYDFCLIAKNILKDKYNMSRVIARPFVGKIGEFVRTSNRKDFLICPPSRTALSLLQQNGVPVIGVGKIGDIFGSIGIDRTVHTDNNAHGIEMTIEESRNLDHGLIFTNLVDFDMKYGHRRDSLGYAKSLKEFDDALPPILDTLGKDDILIITADHGCDPTFKGTDHTREYVPILIHKSFQSKNLGTRETFADIGATVLKSFGIEPFFDARALV